MKEQRRLSNDSHITLPVDRQSLISSYSLPSCEADLIANEFKRGVASLKEEGVEGAMRFARGAGRGGKEVYAVGEGERKRDEKGAVGPAKL